MYISQHSTGLKVFKTEIHKITKSDRGNVALSSNFKICMSLIHFRSVFSFNISYSLMFRTIQLLRGATMGRWVVGDRIFVKKHNGKTRVGGFFSVCKLRDATLFYTLCFLMECEVFFALSLFQTWRLFETSAMALQNVL